VLDFLLGPDSLRETNNSGQHVYKQRAALRIAKILYTQKNIDQTILSTTRLTPATTLSNMKFATFIAPLFLISTAFAAPVEERQSDTTNIGLFINGGRFDINYLQTFRLSYANSSAYLGAVKYESYSEPLIVNALSGNAADGFSFLSIHQSPTGYQQMYVEHHKVSARLASVSTTMAV
jgi:hypothetical protein